MPGSRVKPGMMGRWGVDDGEVDRTPAFVRGGSNLHEE